MGRIKAKLGLDQCFIWFNGAAPLKKSSMEYFASLDMPIFNIYGLSECTGPTTVCLPLDFSLYHASRPLKGCRVILADKDHHGEGEIRIKGRHIMMGYKDNEQATREAIDDEGFLCTGDLGTLDPDGGWLRITGRIKELIITAGGENVAPNPIEENFKTICPACSNIVLLGEGQRFVSALITLKVDMDMKKMLPTNKLVNQAIHFIKK